MRHFSILAAALSTDAREASRRARELSFSGIVFDAFSPGLDLTALSETGRREFRHVLSSQAQTLVALRADLGPKGLGVGADVDRLLSRFDAMLKAAADLNAQAVLLDLGPLPAPAEAAKPKPRITPEQAGLILIPSTTGEPEPAPAVSASSAGPDRAQLAHVDTALAAFGEVAERYRLPVALSSSLAGFAALGRAIEAARCPWFGIDLDAVALLRDAWPPDEFFSRLGPLVQHVRARDAVLGADSRTRPALIGAGGVRWNELLAALNDADYTGWITLDPMELPDRVAAARAGLERLREG